MILNLRRISILLTILLLCGAAAAEERKPAAPVAVTPGGDIVHLELALTPEQRVYGLMFRESMPPDMGMLFVFESCEPQGFWMKNCFFPQDIIWLDRSGKVLKVLPDLKPCRSPDCPHYEPAVNACFVLELNAGKAEEFRIREGESVKLRGVPGYEE